MMGLVVTLSLVSLVYGFLRPMLLHRRHGLLLRALVRGFLGLTTLMALLWFVVRAMQTPLEARATGTFDTFVVQHASAPAWLACSLIAIIVECAQHAEAWVLRVPVAAIRAIDSCHVGKDGLPCARKRLP